MSENHEVTRHALLPHLRPSQQALALPKAGIAGTVHFVVGFIAAPAFLSIIPQEFNKPLLYTIAASMLTFCAIYGSELAKFFAIERAPVVITGAFMLCGLITNIINKNASIFNVLMPFCSLFAYIYASRRQIDLKIFDIYLCVQYLTFLFTYYLIIPDLFYRPDFDEDLDVYDNCSSNTIPIHLNVTLLIYMLLNHIYNGRRKGLVIAYAILNLALIIIQQSRMGLACSLVILLIALSDPVKGINRIVTILVWTLTLGALSIQSETIQNYLTGIRGRFSGLYTLSDDIRGAAQAKFFELIDFRRAILGFEKQSYAESGGNTLDYTYNTLLDSISRYGIIPVAILFTYCYTRLVKSNRYQTPLIYFPPLIMYWMVESINFPNFWDFFVLLMFFCKNPRWIATAGESVVGARPLQADRGNLR